MIIAKEKQIKMSDRTYVGANPVYQPITDNFGMIVGWTKVAKGIPYRRMPPKPKKFTLNKKF